MSTAERFLEPEYVDEFIEDTLEDDYLHLIGEEGAEIGLCPYITFYIYHDKEDFLRISEQVIAIYREFEQIIDEPFKRVRNPKTQNWVGPSHAKNIDWHERAQWCANHGYKEFWLKATDQDTAITTPRWGFSAEVTDTPQMCYSILKLTFRHHWYNRNQTRWHAFVADCLARLQPDQCYSGFEVGNGGFSVLGNYECETLERISADYFYGMDIDHASKMAYHYFDDEDGWVNPTDLSAGLRPPVWSFILSPHRLARLGKTETEVRAELDDPRIVIQSIPYAVGKLNPDGRNALWIRLGELDLHPVDNGVPDLLVKANRLIRPIRCDELKLLSLDVWDDDPNPRFGYEDSLRWMRRFDEDSDWPAAEKRSRPAAPHRDALRALPSETVTRGGVWYTPAIRGAGGTLTLASGAKLPDTKYTDYGEVIWYWQEERQG